MITSHALTHSNTLQSSSSSASSYSASLLSSQPSTSSSSTQQSSPSSPSTSLDPMSSSQNPRPSLPPKNRNLYNYSALFQTPRSAMEKKQAFRFFDLPRELRDMIYEFAFSGVYIPFNPSKRIRTTKHPNANMALKILQAKLKPSPKARNGGALLVSRQMNLEATTYYYNLSAFDNRHWKACVDFVVRLSSTHKAFITRMRMLLHPPYQCSPASVTTAYSTFDARINLIKSIASVLSEDGLVVSPGLLRMTMEAKGSHGTILTLRVLREKSRDHGAGKWGKEFQDGMVFFPGEGWRQRVCNVGGEWLRCKRGQVELEAEKGNEAEEEQEEKVEKEEICARSCCMEWSVDKRRLVRRYG